MWQLFVPVRWVCQQMYVPTNHLDTTNSSPWLSGCCSVHRRPPRWPWCSCSASWASASSPSAAAAAGTCRAGAWHSPHPPRTQTQWQWPGSPRRSCASASPGRWGVCRCSLSGSPVAGNKINPSVGSLCSEMIWSVWVHDEQRQGNKTARPQRKLIHLFVHGVCLRSPPPLYSSLDTLQQHNRNELLLSCDVSFL